MTLKTGRKCSWDEIKVDEVFAMDGCWFVLCKTSKTEVLILACSWKGILSGDHYGFRANISLCKELTYAISLPEGCASFGDIYKLPKSTQRLWKEE